MSRYHQQFDTPSSISNNNLQKIINFYVLECPVPEKSARGKKFDELGFVGSLAFNRLKKEMINAGTKSLKKYYIPCKQDGLESTFKKVEIVSPPDEYCVFLKYDEDTVMQSLFSAIRNAFAHGSFNVKSYHGVRIYFLVNYKKYKKAQIVLQEKTLLSWIKLVQSGYSAMISQ